MARNEKSEVRWKIDITGAQSLNSITKQLDEVLQKFRQIEKYQEQIKGGGAGRSGGKSGKGGFSPGSGYASNRMAQMKLKYRKGEINSLKELQGHYGQVTAALNKMENEGKNVASQRLRLHKLNDKMSNSIREKRREMQKTTQAKSRLTGVTNKQRASMVNNMGAMSFGQNQLKSATQQMGRSMNATKNASYTLLNVGYLIQDSPYGVRGMANNVSQLTQSWQMLNRRVQKVNSTTTRNISVWGQLGKMLKGSTGIMILIGSVLPAALEYVNIYWSEWTGTVEDSKEELEDSLKVYKDVASTFREMSAPDHDPTGMQGLIAEREDFKERRDLAKDIRNQEKRAADIRQESVRLRNTGHKEAAKEELERAKELEQTIENRKLRYEELFGVTIEEMEKLKEEINNVDKEIEGTMAEIDRQPGGQDFISGIRELNKLTAQYEEAEILGDEDRMQELQQKFQKRHEFWLGQFKTASKNNSEKQDVLLELARTWGEEASNFGVEGAEDAGVEIGDSIVEATANRMAERFDMAKWADEGIGKVKANIRKTIDRLKKERKMLAREGDREAAKQTNRAIQTLEDIGSDDDEGEGEGSQYQIRKQAQEDLWSLRIQRASQEVKTAENTSQEIQAIEERKNLKLEQLRHNYMESDEMSYRQMVQQREQIVFQSEQNIQQIREKKRKEDLRREKKKEKAKRSLVKQGADAAITSIQAVAQFTNASARSQFQIQKVASASQAIINGYLAYTKTMAQGGFLAKPLAITAMLSSFAQASKIMSQSFDSARATGAGGVGGASVGYRGLDFANSQSSVLNNNTSNPAYTGTNTRLNNERSKRNKKGKQSIDMRIRDGYGNIVAKGVVENDRDNENDLGYWTNNSS